MLKTLLSKGSPKSIQLDWRRLRRKRLATETLPAALLFLVLTLVATWPLAQHLRTQVIGPFYGDNLEYIWKIWWVKHALLDLGRSPWIHPDVYYPYGYPLAYGEITPIHTFLGVPLTALLGPIATYNLFILGSVALSGFFTYLFVREVTGSPSAGIVAGAIFALCPYRMARIAGHLPLVDTQWLPLYLLFLDRFLRWERWTDAALGGLFFAASALSSWYYGLALGLLTPVFLLFRAAGTWRQLKWKRWLGGGAAFVAVAAVLLLPFLLPYLRVQREGAAVIPLEQVAFWSASLTDYMVPNPRHFWWGNWVQRYLTPFPEGVPYEFLLGWGWFPTLLALYGWRGRRTVIGRGWGWWIGLAFILSLGPALKLFGAVITLPLPVNLADTLNGALDWLGLHSLVGEPYTLAAPGRLAIPLPALLLRWFLPGLAGMRSWGRFALYAAFGVATLAGAGTALFLQKEVDRWPVKWPLLRRWAVTLLLVGLVFLEFYTGPQALISPERRPVDVWLAAQPRRVTVIQMPLAVALSGPQIYYTMHHGQRIASGYGTYFPILFEEWYPELASFPSDEALDLLAVWGGEGIDWVLIDEADVPPDDPLWDAIAAQDGLQSAVRVGGVRGYRVR